MRPVPNEVLEIMMSAIKLFRKEPLLFDSPTPFIDEAEEWIEHEMTYPRTYYIGTRGADGKLVILGGPYETIEEFRILGSRLASKLNPQELRNVVAIEERPFSNEQQIIEEGNFINFS